MAKKTKKETDLQLLSSKELSDMVRNLKEDLRKLRFDKAMGVGSSPDSLPTLRKQIARAMTALSVKKLGGVGE